MKILRVLLGLLILSMLCACGLGSAASPSGRALEAMNAVKEGKPDEFRTFVLTRDSARVDEMYELLSKSFSMNGGVKTIEVESESIEGDKATVKILWRWSSGKSTDDHIRLRLQDGTWMLVF